MRLFDSVEITIQIQSVQLSLKDATNFLSLDTHTNALERRFVPAALQNGQLTTVFRSSMWPVRPAWVFLCDKIAALWAPIDSKRFSGYTGKKGAIY